MRSPTDEFERALANWVERACGLRLRPPRVHHTPPHAAALHTRVLDLHIASRFHATSGRRGDASLTPAHLSTVPIRSKELRPCATPKSTTSLLQTGAMPS